MYRTAADARTRVRVTYRPYTGARLVGYAVVAVAAFGVAVNVGLSRAHAGTPFLIMVILFSLARGIRDFSAVTVVVDHPRGVVTVMSAFSRRVRVRLEHVAGAEIEVATLPGATSRTGAPPPSDSARINLLLKDGSKVPLDGRMRVGLPKHRAALDRLREALEPARPANG